MPPVSWGAPETRGTLPRSHLRKDRRAELGLCGSQTPGDRSPPHRAPPLGQSNTEDGSELWLPTQSKLQNSLNLCQDHCQLLFPALCEPAVGALTSTPNPARLQGES